jgi:Alpha amylase, catalytic domain
VRSHPHLYEINTWAWLERLTRRRGHPITLGNVPDEEWDELHRRGFDLIWLMGVWERSPESQRIFQTDAAQFPEFDKALPGWTPEQIVGSPYSVRAYSPDARMGTWAEIDAIREKLHARGMGLLLDFVPNHTALDHTWVRTHPEFYIQGTREDARNNPEAFFEVRTDRGATVAIARARDPYFPPWKDVAQLNLFESGARAALLDSLREIARHCDGVRCDMAMLVLNEIFANTWSASLAGRQVPTDEFWTDAIAGIPGLVWLAEVYWGREPQLQDLGFSFTYDKVLYDRLLEGNPRGVRAHLTADLARQNRMARFLENHDEARSATVFGADRLPALATLLATLPGMRFFQQGQLEGNKIHLPIALAQAAKESADPEVSALYRKLLQIANDDVYHDGEWKLFEVIAEGDATAENLIAYRWHSPASYRLVVANLGGGASQGRIQLNGEVLSTNDCVLYDALNAASYSSTAGDVAGHGLHLALDGYHAHVFEVLRH